MHLGAQSWWMAVAMGIGVACRPSLPPAETPPPPTPPPPTDTWAPTGDTGVTGPCAVPEVEPNDLGGQASPLVFERTSCGVLDIDDRDVFSFIVEEAGWVSVEVEGADGSPADVRVAIDGPDGLRIDKDDDTESTDVTVRFEAQPGAHVATVSEARNQGGPTHAYDLLVSEAKAPVEWTRREAEPNDDRDLAEVIAGTASIFGTMAGNAELADRDWFEVAIPGGAHALSVDVDAYAYGSAADLQVEVRDADNGLLETFEDVQGGGALQRDPLGTYLSSGDETVRLQVVEESGLKGAGHWYVLHLTLEAQ